MQRPAKGARGEKTALNVGIEIIKLAVILGCIILVGVQLFAPFLVDAFGIHNDVKLEIATREFMQLRALSAPAVVAITALNGALRGIGDSNSALYAAVISSIINLGLDILLIFGPPQMGQNGAAVATAVAETIGAIFLWYQFTKRRATIMHDDDKDKSKSDQMRDNRIIDDNTEDKGITSLEEKDSFIINTEEKEEREDKDSSTYVATQLPAFFQAAGATIIRSLSLQLFLAGTTSYLGFYATDRAESLGAHQVLKQLYIVLSFATGALSFFDY